MESDILGAIPTHLLLKIRSYLRIILFFYNNMIRHIAVLTRLLVLFQCLDASAEEKTALLETDSNVRFTQSQNPMADIAGRITTKKQYQQRKDAICTHTSDT